MRLKSKTKDIIKNLIIYLEEFLSKEPKIESIDVLNAIS